MRTHIPSRGSYRLVHFSLSLIVASTAYASANHLTPTATTLAPAERLSGGTPIDLHNGTIGSNGTYGLSNPKFEAKRTSPLVVPGMPQESFDYERKADFISVMKEKENFYESAIINLKATLAGTKPEALSFEKDWLPKLENQLSGFRSALSRAQSASASQWTESEAELRRAFSQIHNLYKEMTSIQN